MEIEAAVRDVHGHAVLHEFQAAAVEGALDAGTTDGDAGFFCSEPWLNKDARRVVEDVFEGGGFSAFVGFGIDDVDAAGDGFQLGSEGFDGGDGQGDSFPVNDGFRHGFNPVGQDGCHGWKEDGEQMFLRFHGMIWNG